LLYIAPSAPALRPRFWRVPTLTIGVFLHGEEQRVPSLRRLFRQLNL